MEDEEYFYGSIPNNTSRKTEGTGAETRDLSQRTHDQFAADDTRSQPQWISDFPTSVSNNINFSASSTTQQDNGPTTARYSGDGLDFRRPVMSESADLNFIDLTEEPDTPPQALNRPRSTASRAASTRASRLPRFSRDVIDLEEEDYEVEPYEVDDETQMAFNDAMGEYNDSSGREESPGFEILAEHSIRPPTPPAAGIQGAASYISQLRPAFPRLPPSWRGTHPNTPTGTFSLRNFFRMNTEGARLIDAEERERQQHPLSFYRRQQMAQFHTARIHQLIDDSPADPTARFQPPGPLDFDVVPFNLHHDGTAVPPLPTYEAPPPPRPGFTRSPAETDTVVCPNCNEELGIGDDEIKRQVWVVKKCGHVC
ncbi:hypothetical protein MMC18_002279 [Xylographa bjoerkii]|nr:hypothetical protein [Xylographa bjoerkii]